MSAPSTPQFQSWEQQLATGGAKLVGVPFCPDLLRIEDIGEADNLRGRVVRAFFRLIAWWKP